jgi:hypothetical protein
MTKAKMVTYEDLASTFRYEEGKLFRLWRGLYWKEMDLSASNTRAGYVSVSHSGRMLYAHRIIYSLFYGVDVPSDMEIDHANGNRIDNSPSNLILGTARENQQNQHKHREGKLCGCDFRKDSQKWEARVRVNGKLKHLGLFATAQEAHQRYQQICLCLDAGITII